MKTLQKDKVAAIIEIACDTFARLHLDGVELAYIEKNLKNAIESMGDEIDEEKIKKVVEDVIKERESKLPDYKFCNTEDAWLYVKTFDENLRSSLMLAKQCGLLDDIQETMPDIVDLANLLQKDNKRYELKLLQRIILKAIRGG